MVRFDLLLWTILAQIGILKGAGANMSCLVMRPGYGLVTEDCPSHAVGCRIRAKKDHIEWYELSRLYDRNQLVCVYPEEYKSITGCMRKPTGSIRCWCGGRENCNDPETSRDLYEAYTEGDNEAVERISEWLKSAKDESSWKKFTTTEEVSTSTTVATSTKRVTPMLKKKKMTTTTTTTTTKKPITTTKSTTKMTTTTTERTTTTTTSTEKPIPISTKKPKRIGSHKKEPTVFKSKVVNVVDIRDKGVMLPNDDDIQLDQSFEETRKKLEKEMREEDERLREMLADEEEENSNDIDEGEDDDGDITAEDQREMERDRYRMERRRAEENRLQDDVILRRIEEDEIKASEKDEKESVESYARDFDDEAAGSSVISIFVSLLIVLIF